MKKVYIKEGGSRLEHLMTSNNLRHNLYIPFLSRELIFIIFLIWPGGLLYKVILCNSCTLSLRIGLQIVTHTLATSQLDYHNVLYMGLPFRTGTKCSSMSNNMCFSLCPYQPLLHELYWLPIGFRYNSRS